MNRRLSIERLLAPLRDGIRSCCIVGHLRPDGDCIGSQLALALALTHQGLAVSCWNQDPLPDKLAFLDPNQLLTQPKPRKKFDCVIAADTASLDRLGSVAPFITRRRVLLNLDHHVSNTRFGDVNWIAPDYASTGEMVFHLLRQAHWPVTPHIANCLFTAISTDTGSFQYSSTRPSTHRIAADLIRCGADVPRICREVYQSFSLARLALLRHLFTRLQLHNHNRVSTLWLRPSDYTRTGATPSDTEGLIDHLRNFAPVVVACLFEELSPNLTRISLRSKDPHVDVNHIAAQFGGGGHPAAAGARVTGSQSSVQRRLLNAISLALAPLNTTPAITPPHSSSRAST